MIKILSVRVEGLGRAFYPSHEEDTFSSVEQARKYFKTKFNNSKILLYYAVPDNSL